MRLFEERLIKALSLELDFDRYRNITSANSLAAAVMILFGYRSGSPDDPCLLLTRRTETVDTHKGQYAFPGGRVDPEDLLEHGPLTAALRETEEEVGIDRRLIRVVGQLPELSTVTGFVITPVIGLLEKPIEEVSMSLSADEIAEAFWAPLSVLRTEGIYRRENMQVPGSDLVYPIDVFMIDHHRIWGATGSMLKNLMDRLGSESC